MAFVHDPDSDRRFVLADGRVLGWSEFGDPGGTPVVNNHGGLVCRFDVEPVHAAAAAMGVRIISPDRPGVATSDPRPGRTVVGWAGDVAELLDGLGVEQVSVVGWSMGGPYALALAHGLADRVRATAVIAGALPLDDQATFAELNAMDRRFTRLAQHHPAQARAAFAAVGAVEGHLGERLARLHHHRDPPDERAAADEQASWLAACMHEASRHPQGLVEEYLAWARPWGFGLADVAGPVAVWQGTADDLVPAAWGERLAGGVADGRLHLLDGQDHFLAYHHGAEILRDLLELGRA